MYPTLTISPATVATMLPEKCQVIVSADARFQPRVWVTVVGLRI